MKITDRAQYAIDDALTGLSRLDRARVFLAFIAAKIQLSIMPVDASDSGLILAHEDDFVTEGENGPEQAD